MMRKRDFGMVRLRAFGTYDFRIVEPARFLREVAGTDQNFRLDEFADTMRLRLVSVFTEALARAGVPALDVAQRFAELGDALLPIINPAMREKYGSEITTFILENVSVPLEVEQAIDKRSSMSLIGSLHDYVKYQMGEAMGQGGEAGAAATGAIRPVRSGAKGSAKVATQFRCSATATSPSAAISAAHRPRALWRADAGHYYYETERYRDGQGRLQSR